MIIFNLPIFFVYFSFLSIFSRKFKVVTSLIMLLMITLISGTRYYSDIDYGPYIELFNDTPSFFNLSVTDFLILYGEPGYLVFTSLIKSLGFDFVAVTIVFSLFSVALKLYICSRLVSNYLFAFSLFLCLHFLTVEFIELRWALSSALVMTAIFCEFKKRRKYFLAFIFLASIFHYFSMLFLCVMLFRFFTFRNSIVIFCLSFLVALSYKIITPSVAYSVDSNVYIIRRLFRYLNDPESSVGLFSYLRILMYFAVVISVYYFKDRFSAFDINLAKYSSLLVSVALLISFVPLLYFRSMVVSDYFMLIVMTILIFKFKLIYRCLFIVALILLFSTWNIIDVSNYEAAGYIFKYNSWLNFLI